jgi:hypothetical protein
MSLKKHFIGLLLQGGWGSGVVVTQHEQNILRKDVCT